MLFNSPEFIFVFLPITLIGFFVLARASAWLAVIWLCVASFAFYAYWKPANLPILAASIVFNYAVGSAIVRARAGVRIGLSRLFLTVGLVGDLGLLGYFKYTDFLIMTSNEVMGWNLALQHIDLPLGISFFTFTQIAYLVDCLRGEAREYNPVRYSLFVSYFPHLIAGPILHHKEMIPQFSELRIFRPNGYYLSAGIAMFSIGLFKKVWLADGIAPIADAGFAAAQAGAVSLSAAWAGVLAYTMQIYFDFSGYSDMAIGASFMLGVRLPANFYSPYKATSIIEFWRRWHMTLSRFLRDYLYFPLGGNRKGRPRRYANLLITMALGGLWHGAGWTFLIWGVLHGLYLAINHAWRHQQRRLGTRNVHAALALVRRDPDIYCCRRRMGIFPGDRPADGTDDVVCDGRLRRSRCAGLWLARRNSHRDPHADRVLCAQFTRDHAAGENGAGAAPPRDEYSRRWLAAVACVGSGNRPADGRGGIRGTHGYGR